MLKSMMFEMPERPENTRCEQHERLRVLPTASLVSRHRRVLRVAPQMCPMLGSAGGEGYSGGVSEEIGDRPRAARSGEPGSSETSLRQGRCGIGGGRILSWPRRCIGTALVLHSGWTGIVFGAS